MELSSAEVEGSHGMAIFKNPTGDMWPFGVLLITRFRDNPGNFLQWGLVVPK